MNAFGEWTLVHGLPAFSYTMNQDADPRALWDPILDPPTRRHFVHLGNRRITLVADNYGLCDLFDEHTGLRWLTRGTGVTRIGGLCTAGPATERLFGPTFVRVRVAGEGLSLERTVLCPEGEQPWVLIRLRVHNQTNDPVRRTLIEEWKPRPAEIKLISGAPPPPDPASELIDKTAATPAPGPDSAVGAAEAMEPGLDSMGGGSGPEVELGGGGTRGVGPGPGSSGGGVPVSGSGLGLSGGFVAVPESGLELELLGGGERSRSGRIVVPLDLEPGAEQVIELRYGLLGEGSTDTDDLVERSIAGLAARLPRASAVQAPEAERDVPWHAALLSGGACADGVLGGHTLDQGSCYSFRHGFNGAARDPLQHALPLVYTEPDLALSVLRNTCAWGSPDGDLPYALRPDKSPWTELFRPSDQNLWALWLAAEYLAATGDVGAFGADVPYHPAHDAPPVPLGENLRRQFRFFADVVGRGEHGHVRILNADWNDLAISRSGVPAADMIEHGESVLNSAMAAWVLPRYAAVAERLGDHATAAEARKLGDTLRELVAGEWNGRWFRRAHGPGAVVGEDDLWLEVQPWAILCGAASPEQARALLDRIEATAAAGSPLGARVRWPVLPGSGAGDSAIWYAINMTLIWAAAEHAPDLGWAWWRRMSPAAHAAAYPDVWEGTLSGPDAYLPPESARPGRTWDLADVGVAMQAYPVANLHAHAQPLLAYLRLLGVAPDPEGRLHVGGTPEGRLLGSGQGRPHVGDGIDGRRRGGGGASFESRVLTVASDGSGRLSTLGPVEVVTASGVVSGAGSLTW
ncbi:hypothetical protein [Nonomuraea sp. NPDC050643]|uniref:GH36-type glycosyl hydrolase domain-containing protein n=1 Tax=Nonomuraea sp. NPDC050643 TaxID=3155660 RepID=UPI0033D905EA